MGDKGFAAKDVEDVITDGLAAHLIRPYRKNEPARFGKLARQRQWIDTPKGQFIPKANSGRTLADVYAASALSPPWPQQSGATGASAHPSTLTDRLRPL